MTHNNVDKTKQNARAQMCNPPSTPILYTDKQLKINLVRENLTKL